MADTEVKAVNMARALALVHIIVGFLLFCFGIAHLVVGYYWGGYGWFGIWIGVWMCIAGGLGIPGTRKGRSFSRTVFASVFMGFSITSSVLSLIIISFYSLAIAVYRDYYGRGYYKERHYDEDMALCVIILILSIVEFAIGIWASVCICLINPCPCCNTSQQQGHEAYTANPGYVMVQGPDGVPMPVPVQAGGGMVSVQTIIAGTQETKPQPVSGAAVYQHQYSAAAAPHRPTSYV